MLTQNLDSNDLLFFKRQVEHVKTRVEEVKYPAFNQREIIPTSFEAVDAKTITYYQYDMVGVAKVISNHADDLPHVSVLGKEFTSQVRKLGDAYGWSDDDIRFARKANVNLSDRLAKAAKQGILKLERDIAFYGDASHNLQGFFSNPNIPNSTAPADGDSSSTKFVDKDAEKIIRDINSLVNSIVTETKGVEAPDTLLMALSPYSHIASTPRSSTSDKTILQFILETNPYIKQIVPIIECTEPDDGWSAKGLSFTGDIMVAYRRSDQVLTLEIPNDFEQLDPERRNLSYIVNCTERIGGVIVYLPLAISIMDGI